MLVACSRGSNAHWWGIGVQKLSNQEHHSRYVHSHHPSLWVHTIVRPLEYTAEATSLGRHSNAPPPLPLPAPRSPLHPLPTFFPFHDGRYGLLLLFCFQVMFREHRESGTNSFRELPGNMLSTELHVYRKALGAVGGMKKGLDKEEDGGGGVGGMGGAASAGAPRGRGGVRRHKEIPHSFALLTSMGIYHGSLALGNEVREGGREGWVQSCGRGRPGSAPAGVERLGSVLDGGFRRLYTAQGLVQVCVFKVFVFRQI